MFGIAEAHGNAPRLARNKHMVIHLRGSKYQGRREQRSAAAARQRSGGSSDPLLKVRIPLKVRETSKRG